VLDNLTTGQLGNLERAISSGRATFVYANFAADAAALRSLMVGSDIANLRAVYHFEPPANSGTGPGLDIGTLIDIALEQNARFIFASNAAGADDSEPSATAVSAAAQSLGLDARVARFFDCYGPRMQSADGWFVPALLDAAVNGRPLPIEGTGEDTCSLRVADEPPGINAPTDIGTHDPRSALEIARTFARIARIGFEVEYLPGRPAGPESRSADITRARVLGWTPLTSLEDGLRITYDWFSRENRLFV